MRIVADRQPRQDPSTTSVAGAVHRALAPIHKTPLGIAVGAVCAVGIFAITVFHVVLRPIDALDIQLLGQYFYGYDVSWRGAFVGMFWGFVTGFVTGWFTAFVRNFAVAVRVLVLKSKAELTEVKDFLDQI